MLLLSFIIVHVGTLSILDSNNNLLSYECDKASDLCEVVPGLVWLFQSVPNEASISSFISSKLPHLDLQLLEYKRGTNREQTSDLEYDITPSTFPEHDVWPHNEQGYSLWSPKYIAFRYYEQPESGAYTLLFPNRNITSDIETSIMKRIRERGLMYELYLPDDCDMYSMTACWRKFFEVSSLEEILLNEYQALLTDTFPNGVVYRNVVPGIRIGKFGEDIYWNNILTRNQFPFVPHGYNYHVRYGDGTDFTKVETAHLVEVHYRHAIKIKPDPGSIVLIDNLEFAHGRTSYEGSRKVTASIFNEFLRNRIDLVGFASKEEL